MKPYYQDNQVTIYHADCMDVLPLLDLEHTVAVTDPPYNIGSPQRILFDNHGEPSQRRLIGKDFGVFDEGAITPDQWLPMMPNVVLTFYSSLGMHKLLNAALANSFEIVQDFHWCKPNPPVPMRSVGFAWGTESGYILRRVGFKHKHNNSAGISPNYKIMPRASETESVGHSTQKPVALMSWLITHQTFPEDSILDPFMGSGSTLVAAQALGRKCIGIEIDEHWCKVAVGRLQQKPLFKPEIEMDKQEFMAL